MRPPHGDDACLVAALPSQEEPQSHAARYDELECCHKAASNSPIFHDSTPRWSGWRRSSAARRPRRRWSSTWPSGGSASSGSASKGLYYGSVRVPWCPTFILICSRHLWCAAINSFVKLSAGEVEFPGVRAHVHFSSIAHTVHVPPRRRGRQPRRPWPPPASRSATRASIN